MALEDAYEGCTDRTMFFYLFGFYTSWMMGIAALAYQKLKGFDDYATHFVGRKDYGVFVMMLTMFASFISGNTITNGPNTYCAGVPVILDYRPLRFLFHGLVVDCAAGQTSFCGASVELLFRPHCRPFPQSDVDYDYVTFPRLFSGSLHHRSAVGPESFGPSCFRRTDA